MPSEEAIQLARSARGFGIFCVGCCYAASFSPEDVGHLTVRSFGAMTNKQRHGIVRSIRRNIEKLSDFIHPITTYEITPLMVGTKPIFRWRQGDKEPSESVLEKIQNRQPESPTLEKKLKFAINSFLCTSGIPGWGPILSAKNSRGSDISYDNALVDSGPAFSIDLLQYEQWWREEGLNLKYAELVDGFQWWNKEVNVGDSEWMTSFGPRGGGVTGRIAYSNSEYRWSCLLRALRIMQKADEGFPARWRMSWKSRNAHILSYGVFSVPKTINQDSQTVIDVCRAVGYVDYAETIDELLDVHEELSNYKYGYDLW